MPDRTHVGFALTLLLFVVAAAAVVGFLTGPKVPRLVDASIAGMQTPEATAGVDVPTFSRAGAAAPGLHSLWFLYNGRWRSVPA